MTPFLIWSALLILGILHVLRLLRIGEQRGYFNFN